MRFRMPRGTSRPAVSPLDAVALPLAQATEADVVVRGFTVNARANARGRAGTWHVEYGPTSAYGSATAPSALPARLAAYYREEWGEGSLAGWLGSIHGNRLVHDSLGGYVTYTAEGDSTGDDQNHVSGLEVTYGPGRGVIQLPNYLHCGNVDGGAPMPRLGGGRPDFRGARFSVRARGTNWVAAGTRLHTWVQANLQPEKWYVDPQALTNWAYTARDFTADVESGEWVDLEWTLENRSDRWTYAGRNDAQPDKRYWYRNLGKTLGALDTDFFTFQNMRIDWPNVWPSGAISFDNFQVTYRQRSVLAASNGGELVAQPAGGSGAEFLTDGWRNGAGREWQSAPSPTSPQDFVFALAAPVTVWCVQIHNATVNPSKDIEVAVSEDGETWTTITTGVLPESHAAGSNFLFHIADSRLGDGSFGPLHATPVSYVRVRITSGYGLSGARWGLGEIEVFGEGATELTDRGWCDVNQDVEVAAGTYHYRVVVTTDKGTAYGPDQTVVVS